MIVVTDALLQTQDLRWSRMAGVLGKPPEIRLHEISIPNTDRKLLCGRSLAQATILFQQEGPPFSSYLWLRYRRRSCKKNFNVHSTRCFFCFCTFIVSTSLFSVRKGCPSPDSVQLRLTWCGVLVCTQRQALHGKTNVIQVTVSASDRGL